MWNKVTFGGKKVISNGLVNRRERERALFLSGIPAAVSVTGGQVTGGEAKPMIKSKTQWWAGLGLSGVLAEMTGAFSNLKAIVPDLLIKIGPLVLLALIFVALMANRYLESRKGIH